MKCATDLIGCRVEREAADGSTEAGKIVAADGDDVIVSFGTRRDRMPAAPLLAAAVPTIALGSTVIRKVGTGYQSGAVTSIKADRYTVSFAAGPQNFTAAQLANMTVLPPAPPETKPTTQKDQIAAALERVLSANRPAVA